MLEMVKDGSPKLRISVQAFYTELGRNTEIVPLNFSGRILMVMFMSMMTALCKCKRRLKCLAEIGFSHVTER